MKVWSTSISDIDDCVSVDCRHGGRCIDEVNAYSCECVPGYGGSHCEQGINISLNYLIFW